MPDSLSMFTPCGMLELTSEPSHAEIIYNQLVTSLSKTFDMSQGTRQEAWAYAVAMMVARAQYAIDRAGNQAHPLTAYDLIPLLEQGYLVVPGVGATLPARAATLAAIDALSGGGRLNDLVTGLRALLGSSFLSLSRMQDLGVTPTVYPASPGGATAQGNWVTLAAPMQWLQLIDPVATLGSQWCAYQSLDTTQVVSTPWQASSTYGIGAAVVPLASPNGFVFQCTTAGTTNPTEPAWPTTVGGTVTDGTVVWTNAGTTSPLLHVGQTITVQGENTQQAERVTVTNTAFTPPAGSNASPGLVFQATFTKSHDIGATVVTGPFPYWWSTQRQLVVILTATAASDRETRRKIHDFMRKGGHGTDLWCIAAATSTTVTGGTIGGISAGYPMGTQTFSNLTFVNS